METKPKSKGERTAERILDAAEARFSEAGYEATSLRAIARKAGIREPSLYNHFDSKQQLYTAVLDRALSPMMDAMTERVGKAMPPEADTELVGAMTDILLEHPKMAAFFQRALQGDAESIGNRLIQAWLDRLFTQAIDSLEAMDFSGVDRADLAIQIIAMFNVTTGYFLSQRALACMVPGEITDPAHIERQKQLLGRLVRATRPSRG